jgi:beta propeller repeat protein
MEYMVLSLILVALSPTNIYTVDDDPGADFSTIQAAIQAAANGDTILVQPGLYPENLSFNNKAITLSGIDPADPNLTLETVLNGRILFDFLEGPDSVVTGITLAGRTNRMKQPSQTGSIGPAITGISSCGRIVGATSHIYAYDLISHVEVPVCTAAGNQRPGRLRQSSSGRIGAAHGRHLCLDLSTKTEMPICTATGNQYAPGIFGNIVVWQDRRSGTDDIYGYDLTTKTEFVVCGETGTQSAPVIGERYIVWKDTRSGNDDIYAWDLVGKTELAICTARAARTLRPYRRQGVDRCRNPLGPPCTGTALRGPRIYRVRQGRGPLCAGHFRGHDRLAGSPKQQSIRHLRLRYPIAGGISHLQDLGQPEPARD